MQGVVVHRRRFSADDVMRMLEAGVLNESDPVELIDGELIQMSPQGPLHRSRTVRVRQLLEAAFGSGFHVQDHSPIAAGPDSLPEPDVAVIRGEVDDFADRHPAGPDVALVVEISMTTQAYDRAKAAIYAQAGVPTYWNLDLHGRRLFVYGDLRAELGEYATVTTLAAGDTVAAGASALAVSDLLPR